MGGVRVCVCGGVGLFCLIISSRVSVLCCIVCCIAWCCRDTLIARLTSHYFPPIPSVFEKRVILDWIAKQGHICPLTGAPLCETDLKPMEDLGQEIREWILESAQKVSSPTAGSGSGGGGGVGSGGGEPAASPSYGSGSGSGRGNADGPRRAAEGPGSGPGPANDDLYDF